MLKQLTKLSSPRHLRAGQLRLLRGEEARPCRVLHAACQHEVWSVPSVGVAVTATGRLATLHEAFPQGAAAHRLGVSHYRQSCPDIGGNVVIRHYSLLRLL